MRNFFILKKKPSNLNSNRLKFTKKIFFEIFTNLRKIDKKFNFYSKSFIKLKDNSYYKIGAQEVDIYIY